MSRATCPSRPVEIKKQASMIQKLHWSIVVILSLLGLLVLWMVGGPLWGWNQHDSGAMWMGEGGWGMHGQVPGPMMGRGFGVLWGGLAMLVPLGLLALLVFAIIWLVSQINPTQGSRDEARLPSTARTCANCGRSVQADWRHCPNCGQSQIAENRDGPKPPTEFIRV